VSGSFHPGKETGRLHRHRLIASWKRRLILPE